MAGRSWISNFLLLFALRRFQPERQWLRKRRQQRTPPEELDYKREAKFQKIVEKVMSQVEKDNSLYKTSDGE
jgi:hypothetical protein